MQIVIAEHGNGVLSVSSRIEYVKWFPLLLICFAEKFGQNKSILMISVCWFILNRAQRD